MKRIPVRAALLPSLVAWCQSFAEDDGGPGVVTTADREPAMAAARAKARSTLAAFLEKAARPSEGTSGHAVKVAVTEDSVTAHFWITEFKASGDHFSELVSNQPEWFIRSVSARTTCSPTARSSMGSTTTRHATP